MAIHFPSQEEATKFENNLDNIFPSGLCQKPKSQLGYKKAIIKNFDPSVPVTQIKQNLDETYPTKGAIRRYHSSVNRNPLPIISITFKTNTYPDLLKEDIIIFDKRYKAEAYTKPVIRCFNC